VETRVVVDEIDLTTATSLKELIESSGIPVELIGGQSGFPGMPQMGGYGLLVPAARYDEARRLIDELELESGQEPPSGD
jgi:Putative prokaryotic signal transducing protein